MVFMPIIGAFLSYIIGRKSKTGRNVFFCGVAVLEFLLSIALFVIGQGSEGHLFTVPGICGMGLNFTVDGFRSIYAMIACFMWMMAALFSSEVRDYISNTYNYTN